MKPELISLIEKELLTPAAARFGLDPATIRSLGGFENYVGQGERDGHSVILRVSHPDRRTFAQIQAEIEFIDHLARHGVSVATPYHSVNNQLIELVESESDSFAVACFKKAPGRLVKREEMTPARLRARGKLLGELHRWTRSFTSSAPEIKRFIWYEEEDFANARRFLPPEDTIIAERLAEITESILAFGKSDDNWGLIHFDAHHGNILFDGDNPTLIDFDDCAYDLFASDLAIPLFYHLLMHENESTPLEYAENYLKHVLAGYNEQYPLDPRWREIFPLILKRREIVLYIAIHRVMGADNLNDWGKRYLTGRKEWIVNRAPYTSFDFERFALD